MRDIFNVTIGCLIALGIHNFISASVNAHMVAKKRRNLYKTVDLRRDEDK